MNLHITDLVHFLGAVALVLMLAQIYRATLQSITGTLRVQILLGFAFGLVAVTQMYQRIEPIEGMLIDMRAVPVALAGAFLGWPGLLVCMAIAMGIRIEAGGVGVVAGLLGILIAGTMGRIWHMLTRDRAHRGLGPMFALALMVCTSFLAALVLPAPLYLWFFKEAAGPLTVLYLAVLPFSALLIERERYRIVRDERMKASAGEDFASGLMPWMRFRRDVQGLMTAGQHGDIAGLALVRIHHRSWLSRAWGDLVSNMVLGGLRARLKRALGEPRLIGLTPDYSIVVPLSAGEMAQGQDLCQRIVDAITSDRFELPDDLTFNVTVSVSMHTAPDIARMTRLLDRIAKDAGAERAVSRPDLRHKHKRPKLAAAWQGDAGASSVIPPSTTDMLFRKADYMMPR